jgi:hypothetical protein
MLLIWLHLHRKLDNNKVVLQAYTDTSPGRPSNFLNLGAGNIGGQTLTPGLYKWGSTVTIPSNITISGSADDVWIFKSQVI